MANYREQLEVRECYLKAEYDSLIAEMDENPSIELSKECSDKYLELLTVRSRLANLDKPAGLPELHLPEFIN